MEMFNMKMSDWKRFWQKVNIPKDRNKCWKWVGATTNFGHGRFGLNGNMVSPHRIIWSVVNDETIPDGMNICHHCDNPSCVNPKHLFLGTYSDNMRDARDKQRVEAKTYVLLQCPECGKIFLREKRQTHLDNPKNERTFCSKECVGRASGYDRINYKENILFVFDRWDVVGQDEDTTIKDIIK